MKRLLYLLLFVCSLAVGQDTQLALSTTIFHRPHWVFTQNQPSFSLPLNDLGAGAVNTTPAFSLGSGTATFTRATTAWTKLSTGLWASVGTGVARSSYLGANTAVGAYGGYLAEGARTNLALQSRDLSTTWTALNATLLKDQIGIDGVTNSASSMTATLANGSALQTITEAATLSAESIFIKRITGTGTVTIQQGASTLEVSGSINSSTYTRVELDATVLNPIIGIVLGTNADKIAVDMVQFENGAFASSPSPTTTVAVTRNADVLTYQDAGNISLTQGTAYAEYMAAPWASATNWGVIAPDSSTQMFLGSTTANSGIAMYDNVTLVYGPAGAPSGIVKGATIWSGSTMQAFANGAGGTPGAFASFGGTSFDIGLRSGGAFFGGIRNVIIYPTALSAPALTLMTTSAQDWLGDPWWNVAANDEQYRLRANQ